LVVVTRGAVGSQEWRQRLTDLGAKVYNLPTMTMSPVEPDAAIVEELTALEAYDWVVFTSANGVRYLGTVSAQLGINLGSMQLPQVAVVGSQTARAASAAGFQVAFEPSVSDSAHLSAELDLARGKRVLLLRTTIASDDLPHALTTRGADVTDLRIYKTEPLTGGDPDFSHLLADGAVDYITFASPSAVAGFEMRLSKADLALAKQLPAVSIGASVTDVLQQAGFQQIHTAKAASLQGVVDMLEELSI
jgi:uroporphyrinogen III methyltransferase/synthase